MSEEMKKTVNELKAEIKSEFQSEIEKLKADVKSLRASYDELKGTIKSHHK